MATITVEIGSIAGESTVNGYANQVEAIGLREAIEVGVRATGGHGASGKARQSDIQLLRYKDSASPKLAVACSAAENLGDVKITVFRTADSGAVPYLQYSLTKVYVARIEHESLDEQHVAMRPHLTDVTRGMPTPGAVGLTSVLAPIIQSSLSGGRLMVFPMDVSETFSNMELERVSLNADAIVWGYTPYVNGVASGKVERGYDLATGTPI